MEWLDRFLAGRGESPLKRAEARVGQVFRTGPKRTGLVHGKPRERGFGGW